MSETHILQSIILSLLSGAVSGIIVAVAFLAWLVRR